MGKYKWDVQARFPRTKKNTKPWSLEKIEKAYRFIDVLKKTRDRILSGQYRYNWSKANSCNAGLIARTALDLDYFDFWDLLAKSVDKTEVAHSLSWQYIIDTERQRCETTGLPMNQIFQALNHIGLDYRQIEIIENFGQVGYEYRYKSEADFVRYLNALIEKTSQGLEVQQQLQFEKACHRPQKAKVTQSVTLPY